MIPNDRKYTASHEWILVNGDTATIGLTDFAQEQLGDIVFVELPQVGDTIDAGGRLAVVESVKAASDVFSVPGGEVLEVNEELDPSPEKINEAPWETWLAKLRVADMNEASLLDPAAYAALVEAEGEKA